ncbi:MAG: transglycosylase SLT domain-containing protein [Alphaproteobacteria bacterium]
MNDTYLIIASVFMLLAGAIAPRKSRDALSNFFGVPANFGDTIFTSGDTHSPTKESVDLATGQFADKEPVKKKAVYPVGRVLTKEETLQLAVHVMETYKIHSTSAQDLTIFAYVESSFRPWVERDEGFDKSTGLMQTLLGTANDMYKKGYTAVGQPTEESLKNPVISMYFGAAYLQWLKRHYSEWGHRYDGGYEDFFIRAYNGGAGWQKTPNGAKNTAHYLSKWKDAKKKLNLPNALAVGAYY